MKYVILIVDGAAGRPMKEHGGKTSLELASTPNLDAMVTEGRLGLVRTVPAGMEPTSACACMSIIGYDPRIYYRGRSAIEARSMGIDIAEGEVVFRCNLVAVRDGKMWDYSAGHISTDEARELILALGKRLGNDSIHFYPGVSYRHILKLKGREETLKTDCTPPHDIPGKPVEGYLPKGPGSEFLRDLMHRSEAVLRDHPVNLARISRGEVAATTIWLFWSSGQVPTLPAFNRAYGLKAAMSSGVDLLRGLATMAGMDILDISGVSDGTDNDYSAQVQGSLKALADHDLVVIHIEAPDEAAHAGSVKHKVEAIERTDAEVLSRLRAFKGPLRLLVMPDHPTPIEIQTHTSDPVPFMFWGEGFSSDGAHRFTESEAKGTGFFIDAGYGIIKELIK